MVPLALGIYDQVWNDAFAYKIISLWKLFFKDSFLPSFLPSSLPLSLSLSLSLPLVLSFSLSPTLSFSLSFEKDFIYSFLEGKGGSPPLGSHLQPRHMPNQNQTSDPPSLAGRWHSIHWTTPARVPYGDLMPNRWKEIAIDMHYFGAAEIALLYRTLP